MTTLSTIVDGLNGGKTEHKHVFNFLQSQMNEIDSGINILM